MALNDKSHRTISDYKPAHPDEELDGNGVATIAAGLTRSPPANAAISTTAAPAMLSASDKANVLARRASNDYRFLPNAVTAEDLDRFHGIDERIAVKG